MDCEKSTYHKCGEIFLGNEKDFSFLCVYCDELFYEFNKLKAHIKNHINESESPQYNILSDFPIESLSEVKSEPDTNYTYKNDDCLKMQTNESIDLIQDLKNDVKEDHIINEDLTNTTTAPINCIKSYKNDDCLKMEGNESIELIQDLNNDMTEEYIINEDLTNTITAPINRINTYKNDDCLKMGGNESIDLIQDLNNDMTEEYIINENLTSPINNNIYKESPTQPFNGIENNEADDDNQAAKSDGLDFENALVIQLTDSYKKNEVDKILNHSKKKKKPLTNIYCLQCKQMFPADSHDFKKCTEMKQAKLIRKMTIPQIVQQNIDELSNYKENSEGEEYSDDFFENILPANKLEMPYQCYYCEKLFRLKYQLDNHIRIHTNYRPFQCTLCPSAFTTQPTLQKHMVCMHTEERPFLCSYEGCKRKFKLQGHLRQHEKIHRSDSLAYQCDICGKQYKARTTLTEHVYLHTGEKPYKCPKCPKTFRSNKTLWVHKKVHSDVRQYSCKFCDRRFKQLSCLYTHLRKYCPLAKASKANSVNTD